MTQNPADSGPTSATTAVTSDPPYRRVRCAGVEVAYTEEGNPAGPPILLLHGVPGTVRDFRYLAPHLAGALRVLRLDLPGFGENARVPLADQSPAGRGRWVLAAADALGLDRLALLGHSMGSAPALAASALAPARVLDFVSICGVGPRRHRGITRSTGTFHGIHALLAVPGVRGLLAAAVRRAYGRLGFKGVDGYGWRDFRTHFDILRRLDFAVLGGWIDGLQVPALVAYAHDDRLVERAVSEELARRLPRATALAFAEGGHYLQKHRAAEIGRAVVARLTGPGRHS
ncbi:MAG: alpha/beta fold hydrolase [Planctomycetes bacterium]|nr:alpha/beta fold hydrolase [Planctomycetota bacterium]